MRSLAAVVLSLFATFAHGAGFEIAPPARATARNAFLPSTASNGDGFLVVWREGASAANGVALDRNATVSPAAFAVTSSGFDGEVMHFGSTYLVAGRTSAGVLIFSELNATGTVVRSFIPDFQPSTQSRVAASVDGRRVAIYDDSRVVVVDNNGRQIGSASLPAGAVSQLEVGPTPSGEFLVTAWRNGQPTVQRLSATGVLGPLVVLDEPVPSANQISIVAAENADRSVVAIWSERGSPIEVNVTTIASNGTIIRRTMLPNFGYPYFEPVDLVPLANNQLALVADIGKLTGEASDYLYLGIMRISAAGDLIDPLPLTVTTSALTRQSESVAYNGETFHVVTAESLGTGSRVKGVSFRLDNGVRNVREEVLSITRPDQLDPKVASGSENFLAVWKELSAEGDVLKAAHFILSPSPSSSSPISLGGGLLGKHAVVSDGGPLYLVVWQQGSQIVGRRIGASAPLDVAPFIIRSGNVRSPAVTWNGSQFLVVWSEAGRIFGATVSPQAAVSAARDITPRGALGGAEGYIQTDPTVAWDGSKYFVVWTLEQTTGRRELRSAIVSAELISPAISDVFLAEDLVDADIAAGNGDLLVVGRSTTSAGAGGVFLDSNGFPITRVAIEREAAAASVVWDTRQYLVATTPSTAPGSLRLVRLSLNQNGGVSRTDSAVFTGSPDIAVNTRIGEIAVVASEVRGDATSPATPRVVAFDEDRINPTAEPVRKRAARR